jgi:ABC-2 type transport system ATP-binding protein
VRILNDEWGGKVIECRAVTKNYAAKPVLRGIDLVVEPGICALLGANGAGKSTLLRLLSGLEEPDSGSVYIGGLGFRDHGVGIRRNLGVLPEGLGLFESLTVIENLMAVGPIYGLTKSETAARAADLLGLLDLTQGRQTAARNCSFGMRKKTALAMALLHKPKVLLLDEPFEGIDPASSAVIQMLLGQLSRDGTTILLTSHILSVVQRIATRAVILYEGRVESDFIPSPTEAGVEEVYFSIAGKPQPEVPDWLRS